MGSIDPKLWGAPAWLLLHDISFYIAEKDTNNDKMKSAKEFFMLLRHVLPCERCQVSYDMHLLYLPFPKKAKDLPKWVFDLHNRVNDTRASSQRYSREDRPIWNQWQKTYEMERKQHTLVTIWPFIQSIITVYPREKGYEQTIYIESVKRFFKLLFVFLQEMEGYTENMLPVKDIFTQKNIEKNIGSREDFQHFITNIGRTIHAETKNISSKCDQHCKV